MRHHLLLWAALVACGGWALTAPAPRAMADDQEGVEQVGRTAISTIYRAANIVGTEVKNSQGEDLGSVNDLVINVSNAETRYAVLSFGGFLGFGDKLFAIPWDAMTLKMDQDGRHFVLDVSRERLEQAEGFDRNNWPNFMDRDWQMRTDRFYGPERDTATQRRTAADRTVAVPATETPATQTPATDPVRPTTEDALERSEEKVAADAMYRASVLKGMEVKNARGEDLGSINELVIDIQTAKVRYAALSFGGFLGFGDKLFAIPFEAMRLHRVSDDDRHFVLNIDPAQLERAQGFDRNNWPNTADPQWQRQIDRVYPRDAGAATVRPGDRPATTPPATERPDAAPATERPEAPAPQPQSNGDNP